MIATKTNKKKTRLRPTDRRRDILREFFANAIVLATIKSGEAIPKPAVTPRFRVVK